jgi:hypothetical protein
VEIGDEEEDVEIEMQASETEGGVEGVVTTTTSGRAVRAPAHSRLAVSSAAAPAAAVSNPPSRSPPAVINTDTVSEAPKNAVAAIAAQAAQAFLHPSLPQAPLNLFKSPLLFPAAKEPAAVSVPTSHKFGAFHQQPQNPPTLSTSSDVTAEGFQVHRGQSPPPLGVPRPIPGSIGFAYPQHMMMATMPYYRMPPPPPPGTAATAAAPMLAPAGKIPSTAPIATSPTHAGGVPAGVLSPRTYSIGASGPQPASVLPPQLHAAGMLGNSPS